MQLSSKGESPYVHFLIYIHSGVPKGACLAPVLSGLIIAHWSQDGKLQKDHINGQHGNVFSYHTESDLIKAIVSAYGDTIVIVDYTKGNFPLH